MLRRARRRSVAAGIALTSATTAALGLGVLVAGGQAATDLEAFTVRSVARGITVHGAVPGFLPTGIDAIDVTTAFAEGDLSASASTAVAAFPYPSDAVLSAPGLAAGFAQLPNLPGYPLAARAQDPYTPDAAAVDTRVPGGEGARVVAHADPTRAAAVASTAGTTDISGLLSQLPLEGTPVDAGAGLYRVGSIRTEAVETVVDARTVRAFARSDLHDVRLVGGLVRLASLVTTSLVEIVDGRAHVRESGVEITGATLAGAPVAVTEEGLVLGGSAAALSPLAAAASDALRSLGVEVSVTRGDATTRGLRASSVTGALVLQLRGDFQGFPTDVRVELGGAGATVEALTAAEAAGATTGGGDLPLDVPPVGGVVDDPGPAVPTAIDPSTGPPVPPSPGAVGGDPGTGSPAGVAAPPLTPAAATRIDFRPVYPWLALFGLGLVLLRRWLARAPAPDDGSLRDLWRW